MPNSQIKSLTVGGVTYDIVDETSGYITGMTILSYGHSTWSDFTAAYNANQVVYCRASSNSDPGSGSQTRLAFMAYVDNATTPTNVEFQYYRSVSTHTASQQGDQVYVYKLTNAGVWSVTVREASVKVAAGGDLTGSYSNGTFTVSGTIPTTASDVGAATSSHTHGTINNDGSVTSSIGDWDSGDAIAVIDATNNQIKKGPIKQNSSSVFLNGLGNWATPSDEKLSVSPVSDTNTYYPILSATSSAGTATRYVNSSFGFGSTSSTAGISIGSSSQSATLQMYANGKIVAIKGNTSTSANREITLPNAGGTVALTSDIPTVPTNVSAFTNDAGYVTTDTKNTAGSTNSSNKIYLIGAESQAANPQTYSNSNLYFNNGLYSVTSVNSNNISSRISQNSTNILLSVVNRNNGYDSALNMGNNSILIGVDNYNQSYSLSVNTSGDVHAECLEFKIELDSTSDATLISDIASLGWTSDVIV